MRTHRPSHIFSRSFGEHLLALRSTTGLSQTQFARAAGIRPQALARWEQGTAFPQSTTLQRLIAVLVQHRGFTSGHEAEEARALWEHANAEGAHRLPLFDTSWLATLLAEVPPIANPPLFDWGSASITPRLLGRDADLALLRHWLLAEGSHIVGMFGAGGIGKSALAVSFASGAVQQFDVIVFRSLRDAPPLHEILQSILRLFSLPGSRDTNTRAQLQALQPLLRERRGLLVLDNLETIMAAGEHLGEYRPGYADYGELIRMFAESNHRWCLLLTSRERPRQFWLLEQQGATVRALTLQGLSPQACQALLAPTGITGEAEDWEQFARHYRGNPLALQLAAATTRDRFAGQLAAALSSAAAISHEINDLLTAQIERTSAPEYALLLWLTIEREPISAQQIVHDVAGAISEARVLQALETLLQRTMIEHVGSMNTFALQPMVQTVVAEQFVGQVVRELQDGQLELICRYALLQGTAKEYLRQSQLRAIVEPCLAQLRAHYGSSEAVVALLTAYLDPLRGVPLTQQRYGGSNLAHLIAHERGNLRAVDLHGLLFLGTNFAGVAMQHADLRGAHMRQALFTGQLTSPESLAVSPDGAYMAAATPDGAVQLWRTTDFVQVSRFPAHSDRIGQIQFRADSAALATASHDGTIGIWTVPDGQQLQRLALPGSRLVSVAWANAGATLFSRDADGRVQRWSLDTAVVIDTIEPLERGAAFAVSADGHLIACGYADGSIGVWNVDDLSLRWMFRGHASAVLALAWHPSDHLLATGSTDPHIAIWDIERQQQVDMLEATPAAIFGLAWSSDDRLIASSSSDGRVRVLELASGRCGLTLDGDPAGAAGVAFFPDGSALASVGADHTVRVWDIDTGEPRATLAGWCQAINALAWHPDGNALASGSSDATVVVWDSARGERIETFPLRTTLGQSLCYSHSADWLAAGGRDGVIRVWHSGRRELLQLRAHADQITAVTFSPDGQRLASASYDGRVGVWSLADGTLLGFMGRANQRLLSAAWHPQQAILASGGMDQRITLWDTQRAEPRAVLQTPRRTVRALAWSADGALLASCDVDGLITVWDWQRQVARVQFAGHSKAAWLVAFHPGEARIASGGEDGLVRLWDAAHGLPLAVLDGDVGGVRSLAWSRDGQRLASGSDQGWIIVWDVATQRELRRFQNERPYEGLRIAGINGITAAQHAMLLALGADDTE